MGIATLTKSAVLQSPELHVLTQEELQQLHNILLEMMNDVAEVCREHDIPWILTGGSALGAVRHKGFIPWDDDIDIAMFREAFDQFKTVFPGKYADKYELKLPGDKGYLYHFPKIYRKDTIIQNIQSPQNATECVSIDIFIMENVAANRVVRAVHGIICTALLAAVSAIRIKRCKDNLLKYGANSRKLCSAVKKRVFLAFFFSFLSLENWLKITDKVFTLCKNDDSEYVVIPSGNGHFFGELYIREKMKTTKYTDFQEMKYPIAEDSDYYLRYRYGKAYMMLPMEEERERHAFIQVKMFI